MQCNKKASLRGATGGGHCLTTLMGALHVCTNLEETKRPLTNRNSLQELMKSRLTEEEQRKVADRRTREKNMKTQGKNVSVDALLRRLKRGMQSGQRSWLQQRTHLLQMQIELVRKAQQATHSPETEPASRESSVIQ
jgi:hypothetical protein